MLFITSDLHYGADRLGDAAVRKMAREMAKTGPDDIFVVAGDIACDDLRFKLCLELFRAVPGKKLFVRGNHELWTDGREKSLTRFHRLADEAERYGFLCLDATNSFQADEYTLVGAMGWYDYAYRDHSLGIGLDSYERKTFPGHPYPLWNDALMVDLGEKDAAWTNRELRRLEDKLKLLESRTRVVAILHHVPVDGLLPPPTPDMPEDVRFARAFLGSPEFGRILCGHPGTKAVFCGHAHLENSIHINDIPFTCVGSDDERKMLLEYDGSDIRRRVFQT
ncbi:metallophosphoesterase [Candidatus Uhrbacteria bacterium]|nr:metallophosphoesterase [Candidatus Uhrbacteria bacterium]